MKTNRMKTLLRASAAFLAGSLVGCAPAGIVKVLQGNTATAPIAPANLQAGHGAMNFTIRWPGITTRNTQAIPNAATTVVAFVWADASKNLAVAVKTYHRNGADTHFNPVTGRYETSATFHIPPGSGYVLELKAYNENPEYADILIPSASASLACGTLTQAATSSSEVANSMPASPSAKAAASVSSCTVTATVLASGTSAPFNIQLGYATPIRINMVAPGGPLIHKLSANLVPPNGARVDILGQGFGTDTGKLRVTLVPKYLNWGGPTDLGNPQSAADDRLSVQLPTAFSGTLYVFKDGVEASVATGSTTDVLVVDQLVVQSDNLKYDFIGQPSKKIYAVAGATVSIQVKGHEANPSYGQVQIDPNNPKDLQGNFIDLPANVIRFTATPSAATASADAQGRVILSAGTWAVEAPPGVGSNVNTIYVGTFSVNKSTPIQFLRNRTINSDVVSALLPMGLDLAFNRQGQSGVAGTVFPVPNGAELTGSGFSPLSLGSDDFEWTYTPQDKLTKTQDGLYTASQTSNSPITFDGTLKYDTSRKISGTLKSGLKAFSVNPNPVTLSQPGSNSDAGLTLSHLLLSITTANDKTATNAETCQNCGPDIPSQMVTWESSDPSIVSVDDKGLIRSVGPLGQVTVSVKLNADPARSVSIPVGVTDNGGIYVEIQ